MIPSRETEEKRQHSTPLIPYSRYYVSIPKELNNVPMHWHYEFEINLIVSGIGEFICGDDRFLARAGDILLIPPNMLHAAYPHKDHELIYHAFVFHPVMLGAGGNDRCTVECIRPIINGTLQLPHPICPDTKNYAEIAEITRRIFFGASGNMAYLDLLLKSDLLRIIWLLEPAVRADSDTDATISYSALVRPSLEYMMQNLRENITIDKLASISHLSNSYFMSCFKKAVGMGAIEHLTHLRINAACDALTDTGRYIVAQRHHALGRGLAL